MSIGSITATATPSTPSVHHHTRGSKGPAAESTPSAGSAAAPSTAGESIEQLAQQGDPLAIAELKAENPGPASIQATPTPPSAAGQAGAREPGKGEQVDAYA